MRIGVISDTHIPDRAKKIPPQILEDFKNVDLVLHAGDLVDSGALKELKTVCRDVRAVRGNMDHPEAKDALPEKLVMEIEKHRVGLAHGYGAPPKLIELVTKIFEKDKVDIIVFGHSHYPINEVRNGILYFNPGSPTDKIFSPYNSYGIIEIKGVKAEGKIIKL
jgi:putative phosphoesterase